MTTLDKETTATESKMCCGGGCKKCNPELQIKDLKGTIEGFQIVSLMMLLVIFLISIGTVGLYNSREYWKADIKSNVERHNSSILRENITASETVTSRQAAIDLKQARNRIHSLELDAMKAEANRAVCNAEKGRIVADYEYKLLYQKQQNKQ